MAIKLERFEIEKINNPSQEALDEIASIIDKYTKTSIVNNQPVTHLNKAGAIDKIFKEIKTKGYKRPSIAKPLFARVLAEKGVITYDNYRTNKIVFTLQNVLRQNNGDVLSIKPSAVAKILPEFAIKGKKGGEGTAIFRTFLNYLEGSQRLSNRSGLQVPTVIAGKPVSQVVDELKQNFLEVKGGRARGDFKVFNQTKLLDRLANENPDVTPNQLKTLYEQNNGTSFKERLKNLYLAKTGQVTNKTTGGKSILEAVKTGDITNKIPTSLKKSFTLYGRDYNFGRFTRFASEETDPKKIRYYNNLANRFFTSGAQTKLGTKGFVAEHGLPIAAYDRGYTDISVRAKIDGYVSPAVNNWKAQNFDFPIFRPGGLADQYSNADPADKPGLQKQIEDRLKLTKSRTPNLVKNIKFDFTDGIFTASSTTPEINEKNIPKLLSQGKKAMSVFDKTTLFDEVRADAAADGPICTIVKSRKQDGGTVSCVQAVEDAIEKNPQKLAQDASRLDKFKSSALGFLKSPGVKRFTLAGAAGAGVQAIVKEFTNDDPTSYLSNEDQQKNMLVAMATDPIAPDFERPAILDYQLPALGASVAGSTALVAPSTIKASRSRGLGVERKGVARTAGRVLGRGLGVAAAPGFLAPLAAMDIASQVAEGDSISDLATDPLNYLYPTFADATPKLTRGLPSAVRGIASLGMSPAALRVLSRAGLLGLGASLGLQGMKLLQDD
jgi:hypothetical protein